MGHASEVQSWHTFQICLGPETVCALFALTMEVPRLGFKVGAFRLYSLAKQVSDLQGNKWPIVLRPQHWLLFLVKFVC